MTYQSDPNTNRRNDIRDDTSYTHWIIGGVVALAIVIAAAAFISTGEQPGPAPNNHDCSCSCSVTFNDWLRYGTPSAGKPLNRSHFAALMPWMRERGSATRGERPVGH